MKEKKDTLVTQQVVEEIIEKAMEEIYKLKQEQGQTLSRISAEKRVLRELENQLTLLKKDIRTSNNTLRTEKRNLRRINRDIKTNNNRILEINTEFAKEEDSYIDLNSFSNQPKKR